MKLKDISKEDLETMTYSEITSIILNEKGSKMKIVDVFKKICKALELSDAEFENKIADYFELISTDKDFTVLDKGYCDLKTRHNNTVIVEEEDDVDSTETEEIEEDEVEEEPENEEEDIFYDEDASEDDLADDDLDDFVVVEDDEEASM